MAKPKSGFDASSIWDRLCEFVKEDDGLPVYPCGGWTIDKLHFLCRYLAVTTKAMKENHRIATINYIDLHCGNGVCVAPRDSVNAKRYPGSALLAAACPKWFHNLYLADSSPANIRAVNSRISNLGYEGQVHTFECDANNAVHMIADMIPSRSLSVAFVDPFRLDGITYDALRRWLRTAGLI